ncbi:MAG: hypothetical protein OER88_04445, partial [Planctomycetota bacterium]|nr:hypothetical protein [Planctomycetota bacterium]
MARVCLLGAAAIVVVFLAWFLGDHAATERRGRALQVAAGAPARRFTFPDTIEPGPDAAAEPVRRRAAPTRPPLVSIVAKADAALLPRVPGNERWREGRLRARELSWRRPARDPRRIASERAWTDCLACLAAAADRTDEDARYERLAHALEKSTDPIARQNLIFLTVLTLPIPRAKSLLEPIEDGGGEDAEDVIGALAFSGDGDAFQRFRALGAPSDAPVHRLIDTSRPADDLAATGTLEARRVLRSYRLIEALDRDVYFDITTLEAPHDWLPPPDPSDTTAERLLRAWLARYPNHPGSDDMALRLGRIAVRRGDFFDGARWFSRACTWPDQRVAYRSMVRLRACAELFLTPGQIDQLVNDEGLDTPNRQWLQYVRLRRIAAEESFARALATAAGIAAAEPVSPIARAWRLRFATTHPKGLDSGVTPLAADDALRRRGAAPPPGPKPQRLRRRRGPG